MDTKTDLGGTVWAGIAKSGGNAFHGDVMGAYEPGQAQLGNSGAYLAAHRIAGVSTRMSYLYEVFGDLGGYIKKDKLITAHRQIRRRVEFLERVSYMGRLLEDAARAPLRWWVSPVA